MSEGEYQRQYDCDGDVDLGDALEEDGSAPIDAIDGRWVTASGAPLLIVKMSDEHLANAIACCERWGYGKHRKCGELRTEQARRAR